MPFVTSLIPWVALDTTNAINVCDMLCIVEPSMGLLLVIGGFIADNPNYKGFQVYNFNSNVWNDQNEYKNLIGYPKEIGIGIFQPRSILIKPGIVLIWGRKHYDSTTSVIYKLNMTVTPWKWEPISSNLGEGTPMDLSYIYNVTESQILSSGYQLPFAFTHSVVDVVDDSIFIIVLSFNDYLENRQMSIIPLHIAQQKCELSFSTTDNLTQAQLRVAGVQPPGSNVILTDNTSDMMLVYNMTLRLWTDTVNLVTDASTNNFAFIEANYSTTLNSSNPSNTQHLQDHLATFAT
ncbi:19849_t:CDS:2 [Cetraspora pellucida]|uniref:19849_t:CDS:1 n=1 Tax=Cetraspora pellucida TaxID=1433469 RepID=A0A9N9C8N3_9GLOM|nr:19849_t:CDS:2 [Cetraspora pellucida]